MPPAHRSFALPSEDELRSEGPSFDLAGENFRCVPIAPAGLLAEMVAAVGTDRMGNQVFHSVDLNRFVLGVIATELWEPPGDAVEGEPEPEGQWVTVDDRERFQEFLFDQERPVAVAVLSDIVIWLVNEYTGRPTEAPARSVRGRSRDGATSGVASS